MGRAGTKERRGRRAARRVRCRRHAPVDDDDACYVHKPIETHLRDRSSAAFHGRCIRAGHRVRRSHIYVAGTYV